MIYDPSPRYVTLKTAVLRYDRSRSTLYVLIKRKDIRAVKHGGRTLIDCASADAYFDNLPQLRLGQPHGHAGI